MIKYSYLLQRTRVSGSKFKVALNENVKSSFAHIFVKRGSIYVKQRPKITSGHSTHFLKYQRKRLFFRYLSVFENRFFFSI